MHVYARVCWYVFYISVLSILGSQNSLCKFQLNRMHLCRSTKIQLINSGQNAGGLFLKLNYPRALFIKSQKVKSLSRVQLFVAPWTVAYQAPLSMGLSMQEYWSGLPFPSPGDLPDPRIEPRSPALKTHALPSEPPGKCL